MAAVYDTIGCGYEDLDAGRWDAQFGWLRSQESIDLGYGLIIAQQ